MAGAPSDRDYAVVYDLRRGILLHRADCGYVRACAAQGIVVLTMMACEVEPDTLTPTAACLRGGVCEVPSKEETEQDTTKEKEEKSHDH